MVSNVLSLLLCVALHAVYSVAESHTVKFDNRCGFGMPHLLKDGEILSRGKDFVSNGAFTSGIAYLQTGDCSLNGEGCTLVEMTLINPLCPGCGSSTDISLIPPLAYSVPTSFRYYNGCDGSGALCSSSDCKAAFFAPDNNEVQVACQDDDVNLLITFCPGDPVSLPNTTETNDSESASESQTLEPFQSIIGTEYPGMAETTSAIAPTSIMGFGSSTLSVESDLTTAVMIEIPTQTASGGLVQPHRQCKKSRLQQAVHSRRMRRREAYEP